MSFNDNHKYYSNVNNLNTLLVQYGYEKPFGFVFGIKELFEYKCQSFGGVTIFQLHTSAVLKRHLHQLCTEEFGKLFEQVDTGRISKWRMIIRTIVKSPFDTNKDLSFRRQRSEELLQQGEEIVLKRSSDEESPKELSRTDWMRLADCLEENSRRKVNKVKKKRSEKCKQNSWLLINIISK